MVALPQEAQEMLNNPNCEKDKPLAWIATLNQEKDIISPHIAPVCFMKVLDDYKLLVAINFATRTLKNLETDPSVSIGVAVHYEGFLVKGKASIFKEGKKIEEVREMVKARFGDKIKPLAAVQVDVEEVYSLKPGPGSKKLV